MVLDLEHFTICHEKGGDSVKPLFPECVRVYVEWAVAGLRDGTVFVLGKPVAEPGQGFEAEETRRREAHA